MKTTHAPPRGAVSTVYGQETTLSKLGTIVTAANTANTTDHRRPRRTDEPGGE